MNGKINSELEKLNRIIILLNLPIDITPKKLERDNHWDKFVGGNQEYTKKHKCCKAIKASHVDQMWPKTEGQMRGVKIVY